MPSVSPITVVHPPRERWGAVLNLALSHRPFDERVRVTDALLKPAACGPAEANFAGLREARQGEQTVGAALAVVQPGRTALVYQPRLSPGTTEGVRAQLYAALDEFLIEQRVQLAQEVLAVDADEDAAHAKAAGYPLKVQLVYMVADGGQFPDREPTTHWQFDPFQENQQTRLETMLDQTYTATLDCPEINGVRSATDTIAGYRATGEFNPQSWRVIRDGQRDIGCLLVTRYDAALAELIYMGLVPEERGRGGSVDVMNWAKWLARAVGCESLTVALDARNVPAYRAYVRAGFAEFDRRRIILRTFR
jgi:GNAT superfamily N-acetyltransferase